MICEGDGERPSLSSPLPAQRVVCAPNGERGVGRCAGDLEEGPTHLVRPCNTAARWHTGTCMRTGDQASPQASTCCATNHNESMASIAPVHYVHTTFSLSEDSPRGGGGARARHEIGCS